MVITDTSISVVELADGDLVGRAAGGDRAAWEGLVQRYTGLLWTTARAFRLGEANSADVV